MTKAAETRLAILKKAFELIYTNGYQTTSVDDIIATTQVTKGAFYYHFKNKDEMGLAVINELMAPTMQTNFIEPLKNSQNPLNDIYTLIKELLLNNPFLKMEYGCPASNLTHEMSPVNNAFNVVLSDLSKQWQQAIEDCLNKGKKAGQVNNNVNARQTAFFIMSGYWGIRNLGKLCNNADCYQTYLKELKKYLKNCE